MRRAVGVSAVALALVFAGNSPAWSAPVAANATLVCATTPVVAPGVVATSGSASGLYGGVLLTGGQVDAAATIVNVGLDKGITRRGIKLAIAVAMQSSSLNASARNAAHLGLFQQRSDASSGLYTTGDRLSPIGASQMFFEQLIARIPSYDTDPRTDAEIGDAVQESGDLESITRWMDVAEALTAQFIPVVEAPVVLEPVVESAPAVAPTALVAPAPPKLAPGFGRQLPAGLRGPGIAVAGAPSTESSPPTATASASETNTTTASAQSTTAESSADSTSAASTSADSSTADSTTADSSTAESTPDGSGTETPSTTAESSGTETDPSTTGSDPSSTTEVTTTTEATPTETGSTESATTPSTTESTPTETTPTETVPVEPAPVPDPPVVDEPAPAPDTSSDPGRSPDTVISTNRGAVLDCAPNNNGGSTIFDPGYIISDEVFYNTAAMTAEQIQAFAETLGADCSGVYCLKNLRVTTPDVPADAYCAAYTGGTDELASAVLAKASVACGLNPQVMLVTLQKESALLTKSQVSAGTYNAAFGWHCPDSGPGGSANCDPKYAGFFNQAFGMAKQWSRYRVDPGKYHYQAGETANVLWNVAETGCGGSDVQIKNTATASLYNYTPYQPNAAALSSYPGVGDKCSAYGNRNFFFLFQKYFGVTGGGLSAAVAINGVNVTIPNSPYVAPEVRGAVVTAPNESVARGLAAGFGAIGLPYVWGGGTNGGQADQGCSRGGTSKNSCSGTVGFDCSGLTAYVLTQSGFAIGTNSGSQRAGGVSVPWSQAFAGDIIGYSGHVAVYLGKINGVDYLLEAPDVGRFVQIRPVYTRNNGTGADTMMHRYWQ